MAATQPSTAKRSDTDSSEMEGSDADTPGARPCTTSTPGVAASTEADQVRAGRGVPYHHGSHEELLARAGRLTVETSPTAAPSKRTIDAIFVPTARRPAYLGQAAALAEALGCTLVTLHSGKWTSAGMLAQRMPSEIDLIAIDVKASDQLRLPPWETSDLLAHTAFARHTDLSAKRNLALAFSRLLGWERILFLDDDITGLNPQHVRQASALLGTYSAVGLRIGGFPDNSVVCLAYREAGGPQLSFVGGGALLIQAKTTNNKRAFFPDIYNEDWFFLLDGEHGLLPTTTAGRVIQQPYDPFRTPDRARGQELGDVLAEGIYWLLDQGRSFHDADRAHWLEFLGKRRLFITEVLAMVAARNDIAPDEQRRRIEALRGSLGRLAIITPQLCDDYLRAWIRDRQAWYWHLENLPLDLERDEALAQLTQPGAPRLTWHFGERSHGNRSRSLKLRNAKPADVLSPSGFQDLRDLQKVQFSLERQNQALSRQRSTAAVGTGRDR
jgi:hypothetical protein